MSLEHELTAANVHAYVDACVEVANFLSTLHAEGRSTVVLPSRGAFPIYKTADHIREYIGHTAHRWVILPFTADESQGIEPAATRRHWVRVLSAESTGIPNNHWDYFQSQNKLLIGGRSNSPEGFGRFVMIDTVISGRAAAEIISELDAEGLDYHLILVIDLMGKKLRKEHERIINSCSRVTKLFVPSLYTEDRGPAMMGITTALFPHLTTSEFVMSLWLELKHRRFMWIEPQEYPRLDNVSDFYGHLHAMHYYASKTCLGVGSADDRAATEWLRTAVLMNLKVVNEEFTQRAVKLPSEWGKLEVTSSMALRIRR